MNTLKKKALFRPYLVIFVTLSLTEIDAIRHLLDAKVFTT
jgi:hypothetical protein